MTPIESNKVEIQYKNEIYDNINNNIPFSQNSNNNNINNESKYDHGCIVTHDKISNITMVNKWPFHTVYCDESLPEKLHFHSSTKHY